MNNLCIFINNNYFPYLLKIKIEYELENNILINKALDLNLDLDEEIYISEQYGFELDYINETIEFYFHNFNINLIISIINKLKSEFSFDDNYKIKNIITNKTIISTTSLQDIQNLKITNDNKINIDLYNKIIEEINIKKQIQTRQKELLILEKGHNYYFCKNTKDEFYNFTEFNIDDVEKIQTQLINELSKLTKKTRFNYMYKTYNINLEYSKNIIISVDNKKEQCYIILNYPQFKNDIECYNYLESINNSKYLIKTNEEVLVL